MQLYAPTSTTPKRKAFRAPVLASIDGLRLGILENGKLNADDPTEVVWRAWPNQGGYRVDAEGRGKADGHILGKGSGGEPRKGYGARKRSETEVLHSVSSSCLLFSV